MLLVEITRTTVFHIGLHYELSTVLPYTRVDMIHAWFQFCAFVVSKSIFREHRTFKDLVIDTLRYFGSFPNKRRRIWWKRGSMNNAACIKKGRLISILESVIVCGSVASQNIVQDSKETLIDN